MAGTGDTHHDTPSVEDVLSSIRRLVTEEENSRRGPREAPPPAGRLVLTREMRIDGPEPESLSEAADLADHIRQIVRAELRGELGERISANIRRMVRREVARALDARDKG